MHETTLLGDWEFRPRTGIDREELAEIIKSWPTLDDTDLITRLAINGAFNEVLNGLDIPTDVWDKWISLPEEDVRHIFRYWKSLRFTSSRQLRQEIV